MELQGRVVRLLPLKEGVSQAGNPYRTQDFIFGYYENQSDIYERNIVLNVRNENIEKYNLAVIDTIFNPRKLSKEDVENLRFIPHTNNMEFILEAGLVDKSNVKVPVVECRAPYKAYLDTVEFRQNVINLIDDKVNNFGQYAGLKFGSMEGSNNEAGNWED